MKNYKVFKRSALDWAEFSNAKKYTIRKNLTEDEARQLCRRLNDQRTLTQKNRGTKYEFTTE